MTASLRKPLTYFAATMAIMMPQLAIAEYPERNIEIVVPFGSGGGADVSARLLAPEMSKILGKKIVVKNITGASGTIGVAHVAAAKANGYTLGIAPIGPATTQPHLRKLPYGLASFSYVCNIMLSPVLVMVSEDSKISSMADLVKKAKAEPGKMTFASAGPGSIPHIAAISLNKSLGVKMKHIPQQGFKNMAQGVTDVISDTITGVKRFQLKPLATYNSTRLKALPDVPTLKELGYDADNFAIWFGLVAPAGTPQSVVDKLSAACGTATASADFLDKMGKANAPVHYKGHIDFTDFVTTEFDKNGNLLKEAGLIK